MLDLQMKIAAMMVPENLPHKTRAEEILEIARYLIVDAKSTGRRTLITQSAEDPSPDEANLPWLKMNADGTFAGFYGNVNGIWLPIPVGAALGSTGALSIIPNVAVSVVYQSLNGDHTVVVVATGGVPPYTWIAQTGFSVAASGTNNIIGTMTISDLTKFSSALILTDSANSTPATIPVAVA